MSLETERERKRAKRTREIEREAVQSSLGLPCQSKAALYVSQLLRFGVVGPLQFSSFSFIFLGKSTIFNEIQRKSVKIMKIHVHEHMHVEVHMHVLVHVYFGLFFG